MSRNNLSSANSVFRRRNGEWIISCIDIFLIELIAKCDCRWIFNWYMDKAIPSLLDPTALLSSQQFRTDQDGQLVEATESSVDPLHSRCGKHSKTVCTNGTR